MPGRSTSSTKSASTPKEANEKTPRKVRLPHFNIIYFLVTIIVIGAFSLGLVLGILITKVQYYEKGVGTSTSGANTTDNAANTTTATPDVTEAVTVGAGHLPPKGDVNAKVQIVEFADFRCPFCEQFYKQTEPKILSDYVDTGKAAFSFRQYAFLGDASVLAANASECANAQDKFWEMHNYLYDNQPDESDTSMYTVDKLTTVAGTLGMDTASFNSCLTDKTYQKNIDKDMSEGGSAGVNATPTIFVNGMLFAGACPYSNIKQAIDYSIAGTKFTISGNDGCTVTAQ